MYKTERREHVFDTFDVHLIIIDYEFSVKV